MMKITGIYFACVTGFAIVSARTDPCPDGQVQPPTHEHAGSNDDRLTGNEVLGYTSVQDFCKNKHNAALFRERDRERQCPGTGSTLKRAARQDEMGPFWANRGKKDPSPTYKQDKLFAEEPHWVLMRRDDENILNYDPFFVTRGKKTPVAGTAADADFTNINSDNQSNLKRILGENAIRGRRTGAENMVGSKSGIRTWDFIKRETDSDSEFFAARGKKSEEQEAME